MNKLLEEFNNDTPMPIHLAQIPDHLKSLIKAIGPEGQKELAEKTGVSYNSIRQFMNGQSRNPTVKTLTMLCSVLMPGYEVKLTPDLDVK